MKINYVKLHNFRNHKDTLVEFDDGINTLTGQNGQGKTNVVEALVVASTTKSPRTSKEHDLINAFETSCFVEIEVQRNFGKVKIEYFIDKEQGKIFKINGNEIKKMSEVFGNLITVYFSPDELKIVSESPNERREFMDTDISQLSGSYYNLITRYNKVLFQRNKLLKTERNREMLMAQISVWNEQLAALAAPIIRTRKGFIEKLTGPAKQALKDLSKQTEELEIDYVGAKGTTVEELKKEILSALEYNLERDIELGYTSIGPHRDDIKFSLNGMDARNFASQGQQRSIVLALKIAEAEIFSAELGENPVLVLDDVFSELDTRRQKKLFEVVSSYQTIVTGTAFKFPKEQAYTNFRVASGIVKKMKK
ncbi:MAG: DNA replication/repair protein RecF [Clostridia bacterium]|nr:DNA replication/repair protein RecF [Clostridia bacterium]